MKILKTIEGYSLVETLVAIAILLLAIVGPMTIAAKGIQSSRYVQEQTVAISLAQEGIEAFIAARNDAALEAFDSGNLSTSWDWADRITGAIDAACFDIYGCNIEYKNNYPFDPSRSTLATCTDDSGAGCELFFFDNSFVRARYSLDATKEPTPYRRAIKVAPTAVGEGLQIVSTVYWDVQLFGGQVQSLTLTGEIYNLYE